MTLCVGDRQPFAAGKRIDRIDAIGAAADAQIFAALSRALARDAVGPSGRDPAADRARRGGFGSRREFFADRREPPREPPRAFAARSEEHKSELQSLMRHSYAGVCLKK